jgi:hypothetical protein
LAQGYNENSDHPLAKLKDVRLKLERQNESRRLKELMKRLEKMIAIKRA